MLDMVLTNLSEGEGRRKPVVSPRKTGNPLFFLNVLCRIEREGRTLQCSTTTHSSTRTNQWLRWQGSSL